MPTYGYKCRFCGEKIELTMTVSAMEKSNPECPGCGDLMVWDPSGSYRTHPFKSFITHHVNGKPMEIGSLHELRNVEKRYGVNFPAYSGSRLGLIENYHNWTDGKTGKTYRG
jgi:putative FmdB family regulatory protein